MSAGRRKTDIPRDLPSNLEAERSVLGAVLIENAGFAKISGIVSAPMFFRDAHRRIFKALTTLHEAQRPLDLVELKNELERVGDLEEAGGAAYVASLVDGVPRSTNVRYYAEIVREKAALRQLITNVGSKLVEAAYAGEKTAAELIRETDLKLTVLSANAINSGSASVAQDLGALIEDIEHRVQCRGQVSGIPTGFPDLDLLTHGWQRRHMVVIAGQTSYGKSVLALNIAHAIAKSGQRVVYYSYEMSRKELQYRLLSSMSEVPLTRILWGNISQDEYAKMSHAMDEMHSLPLEINDGHSRSISQAKMECRQIKAEKGLAAVVFDHFQLMDGVEGENRTQQLGNVSRRIQETATDLDITAFVLSQLTVSGGETQAEPHLEHLRECKQLGHDANQVFMLHPHKPADARSERDAVLMKLICRKNRGGHLGSIWLELQREYVRFVQSEAPESQTVEAPTRAKRTRSPKVW